MEAMAVETAQSRREALRKALFEACALLRDISRGAVSYELSRLIERNPPLSEIPPPPVELEQFLDVERDLLREIGVSEAAIEDIEQLIRDVETLEGQKLTAENVLRKFAKLQDLTCTRSRTASEEAQGIRTRSIWWGVAGGALVAANAGAAFITPPMALISSGFGSAILGKALSEG